MMFHPARIIEMTPIPRFLRIFFTTRRRDFSSPPLMVLSTLMLYQPHWRCSAMQPRNNILYSFVVYFTFYTVKSRAYITRLDISLFSYSIMLHLISIYTIMQLQRLTKDYIAQID